MADINKVFVVDGFHNDLFEVKLPIQHLERLFHCQDVKLIEYIDNVAIEK